MQKPELISRHKSFEGWVEYYQHASTSTSTPMRFTVFLPPAAAQQACPAVYFLSGLTCTEENFTVKSGYQCYAAEHGLIVIVPDTSPRGAGIPGEDDSWDLGTGAGFYVNATQMPWAKNYRMYDYVSQELPALIEAHFPVQAGKRSVMGHSMGGHGALILGLREPERWLAVSAFAPVCSPRLSPLGHKAFTAYLGADNGTWAEYDATELVRRPLKIRRPLLIDQGTADNFLAGRLNPDILQTACEAMDHPITLRMREGYDHAYFFVSTFIGEHLAYHAKILTNKI